jgi:dihydrodipicolinate synthase/N-acetylneuraminate lyase
MKPITGIFPPVPTTFDGAGRFDQRSLGDNVRRWMKTGLAGVLALGSNGEAAMLDEDECDEVLDAVRNEVPSDRLLIAGTGRESTRLTAAACKRAGELGADAVLVRAPFFFKSQMSPEALFAHFSAVADASPVPVLLYNLPGVTGITLTVPLVARLAEHQNIVGIKETSAELERLGQFVGLGSEFSVLCGSAPVAYPALVSGASGAILAVANVLPDECVELFNLVQEDRYPEALEQQRRLTKLAQLVTTVHGVAGLKVALELVGFHGGPVRAPLMPLASKAREEIAHALTRIKEERARRSAATKKRHVAAED